MTDDKAVRSFVLISTVSKFMKNNKLEVRNAFSAVKIAKELVIDKHKEHFIAIYLNARSDKIAAELVSVGTINAALVHPREVFRTAIIKRACSVIVLHNHPSGHLEPSEPDIELTKRLTDCGKLLGIDLNDHIIFNSRRGFHSII